MLKVKAIPKIIWKRFSFIDFNEKWSPLYEWIILEDEETYIVWEIKKKFWKPFEDTRSFPKKEITIK